MPTEAEIQATEKVTFDDKQQERVNQLIREKQGEAAREVRAELATAQTTLQTLQADLSAARAEAAAAKTKTGKTEANADVAELKSQIEEIKRNTATEIQTLKEFGLQKQRETVEARNETSNVRKTVAVTEAAGKCNFVDAATVCKATADNIKYDEVKGRFVVLGDNGQERLNSSFEPMTVNDFFTEWAAKNPWAVRGDVRSGIGSTESTRSGLTANGKYEVSQIFGPKSDSRLANNLAKENIAAYRALRVEAVKQGLLAN